VPAELQENGPNDPTTLCIVHSGVNSKLIKYFIYFRLHPWRVRGFENPLRPIHRSFKEEKIYFYPQERVLITPFFDYRQLKSKGLMKIIEIIKDLRK
jgi:hypothetical protein